MLNFDNQLLRRFLLYQKTTEKAFVQIENGEILSLHFLSH